MPARNVQERVVGERNGIKFEVVLVPSAYIRHSTDVLAQEIQSSAFHLPMTPCNVENCLATLLSRIDYMGKIMNVDAIVRSTVP